MRRKSWGPDPMGGAGNPRVTRKAQASGPGGHEQGLRRSCRSPRPSLQLMLLPTEAVNFQAAPVICGPGYLSECGCVSGKTHIKHKTWHRGLGTHVYLLIVDSRTQCDLGPHPSEVTTSHPLCLPQAPQIPPTLVPTSGPLHLQVCHAQNSFPPVPYLHGFPLIIP